MCSPVRDHWSVTFAARCSAMSPRRPCQQCMRAGIAVQTLSIGHGAQRPGWPILKAWRCARQSAGGHANAGFDQFNDVVGIYVVQYCRKAK